ncbi:unnamed protein product [Adineta steineri]|uniref:Uncharacterized protein n=1 Tax=Adineta steineri TaxID=433720 RepID=A0A814EEJ1_9BILA|nr:unnamed protein product [Adineta steineri]CAF0942382.1 unnamed protein product [Adineta steineri]CAF0967808.1 unnamed protein product [Adineta steineri]CAF3634072.1 unnamed protein product [Adineta steineri]CAF4023039.1 unnamed protein product [Adineta steineri]
MSRAWLTPVLRSAQIRILPLGFGTTTIGATYFEKLIGRKTFSLTNLSKSFSTANRYENDKDLDLQNFGVVFDLI